MKLEFFHVRLLSGLSLSPRRGYRVSSWVWADSRPGSRREGYRLTLDGDGRYFAHVRTLAEARAIGAQVDATKPTLGRNGMLTAAATARVRPFASTVRSVG